jgi:UDP-glucose 4-epimerase
MVAMHHVIIVTGIRGRLARLVAGTLAAQKGVRRVIGVDRAAPDVAPAGVETRLCDMRAESLRALLGAERAAVVVHLAVDGEEAPLDAAAAAARENVLLAMELLGACAAAGVRRVVLRSSSLLYGARPGLPGRIPEATPLQLPGRSYPLRDYLEIERFVENLAGRSLVTMTCLRCAPLVGGGVSSPLARYLQQPAPPVWLGFDPRIQVLHAEDAAVAFALAALADAPPVALNIASEPVLMLSQAIRLAGRLPLGLPGAVLRAAARSRRAGFPLNLPFDPFYLRYSCVGETRAAREQIGFVPRWDAITAVRELAGAGPSTGTDATARELGGVGG